MRDDTIAAFLDQLAARVSAPGGGATAALHAAQAAALLAMVARYSDGPKYDAGLMNRIVTEADALREDALALAEADAKAFDAVARSVPAAADDGAGNLGPFGCHILSSGRRRTSSRRRRAHGPPPGQPGRGPVARREP